MTVAYATVSDLESFIGGEAPDGVARLLERASEVIDGVVRAPFDVDTTTDLPTDSTVAAALRDATCAQIEFWAEVGEEHDIDGSAGKSMSIGQLNISELPPVLAPRARRALSNAGLMGLNPALPPDNAMGWPW